MLCADMPELFKVGLTGWLGDEVWKDGDRGYFKAY